MSIFDISDKDIINPTNLMDDGWEYNGVKWVLKINKPIYRNYRKITIQYMDHIFVYENNTITDISLWKNIQVTDMKEMRIFIRKRLDLTYECN